MTFTVTWTEEKSIAFGAEYFRLPAVPSSAFRGRGRCLPSANVSTYTEGVDDPQLSIYRR